MKHNFKRRHVYLIEIALLLIGVLCADVMMRDNQQNAIKRGHDILSTQPSSQTLTKRSQTGQLKKATVITSDAERLSCLD